MQYAPTWLEAVAYIGAMHFILWDLSRSYKAWLLAVLARVRELLHPPRTRIVGRLARDLDAAMRQAGI